MRKYILAAMLAGGIVTPAMAQNASPFTGFRLEGLAGYDSLRSGEDDDGTDANENEGDETIDGVAFGVGAGYDIDINGIVVGLEGEFSESTGEQETDESVDVPFSSRIETGRDIYVGARIGAAVAPRTLLYAKGGYTNTSIESAFEGDFNDDDVEEAFEFDTNVDGFRAGVGIEQLFGERAFGKLEYRYSNYSNLDFSDNFDLDDFDAEDVDTDIDLDRHQVMAGVGIRF